MIHRLSQRHSVLGQDRHSVRERRRWRRCGADLRRTAAVTKLVESVGGKLEQLYWSFGEDDYLLIVDGPDDISVGAAAVAAGSSGSLGNVRTVKLFTQEEGRKLLDKAKAAKTA